MTERFTLKRCLLLCAPALGDAYPWEQYRYKKIPADSDSYDVLTAGKSFAEAGPEWNPLTRRKDEFRKVTSALARDGFLSAPLAWARFTLIKTARGLADSEARPLSAFRPAEFWERQRERNDEHWQERTKAMVLMYEMDRPRFDNFLKSCAGRTGGDPSKNIFGRIVPSVLWFTDDTTAHRVSFTWIGALGLLSLIASLRQAAALPLIAALALSLGSSYGIGVAAFADAVFHFTKKNDSTNV